MLTAGVGTRLWLAAVPVALLWLAVWWAWA